MNMKVFLALLLVCCFAVSFGFAVSVLLPQYRINVASDLTLTQETLVEPNVGGGGDGVPGPGVPR